MTPLDRLTAALADRYRIERELGQGGMATVYLAQDLKHDREVAIKVLRPELAAVIGAERFLQEIRTTANLQHPHILPLHDSGQVDGTVFYVMPYIGGESLRDRLTREKQLPIDEALRVGREVADALGYAHERGIIHRDIKPENILLQRGHALVADFGIALAASRTGSSRMTETGMSLGTPHYMSPEQAMGERELSPRSDVYALGCVCYEMLCGEPPFTGPTPQAIVARVMTDTPRSLRSQRQTVPENVEAAVLQALEKLPADRFGSAGDFAAALGQPSFTRTTVAARRAAAPAGTARWRRVAIGFGVVAAVLAVALAMALQRADDSTAPAPVIRFEVAVPDSIPIDRIAITPDGTRLLVTSTNRAYLYRFADMSWVSVTLPGLQNYSLLSFSPDGRMVVFVDDARNLKVVGLSGGLGRTLAEGVRSANWEHDGSIYFTRHFEGRDQILRVAPEGGALEELVVASDSTRRLGLGTLLPAGQLIYTEATDAGSERDARSFTVEVSSRKIRPLALAPGSWAFGYAATGHLLVYGRETVDAVGFDAARLELRGAPVQLLNTIPLGIDFRAGMLAYAATPPGGPALFDRAGRRRELPGATAPGSWGFGARASPSGHAIVFWRYQSPADRWDVFTYRLPAGPVTRLTSDSAGYNTGASWAPDGQTVRFLSRTQGRLSGYRARWDGSGPVEPFLSRPANLNSLASLPDGRVVVEEQGRGLLLLTLESADSTLTLVPAAAQPRFPRISPDGRWLAYSAVELGRREVFVRPLDGGTSRWQVSRNGGNNPVWGRSGRELFFYVNDSIRVTGLSAGPGFQAGEPRALFRVDFLPDFSGFDVLPGDSLFVLYSTSASERERIFVVANFLEELRGLNVSPPVRPR
jgi:tRNA A-37 threonylcarbamoyl transferase component Bud32